MRKRICWQRGVAGECIRQYTAADGAPMVWGDSARNVKPPVKEDDHVKRWKGWLFLRRRSGRLNGQRSAPCFLRAVYKDEKARDILACCQGSSLRDLGRGRHTDSEDDAVRSDGGRRRHDSSDDRSSTGGRGEAPKHSSPEDNGGAGRQSQGGRPGAAAAGTGAKTTRRRRTVADAGGRRRRGAGRRDDAAAAVRTRVTTNAEPREARHCHDSSDDDDGSDSVDATGRAKRMSSGRRSGGREEAPHEAAQGAREVEREERRGRPYGLPGQVREEKGGRARRGRGGAGPDREGEGGEAGTVEQGCEVEGARGPGGGRARGRFLHDGRAGDRRPVPRGAEEGRDPPSCGMYTFSSRPGVPISCQSPHISVLMIMCCFNQYHAFATLPLLVLLRRDCVDHIAAALGYDDGASRVISARNTLSGQRLILDSNDEHGSIDGPGSLVDTSAKADANVHGVWSVLFHQYGVASQQVRIIVKCEVLWATSKSKC
ncbi:hypothetical protein THAOC_00336 [Thalassiosira oceanica]|uniref:Uncharacterized protein n=1 Tax=Thalassiosira oceanica TaxID=159749 RepID=K3W4E7_THAOC|nr:hypothetical protein THAOC_00336 [Thalassiosira oceanica]|eukprot:EJK77809.1 hypothetical protein THAOC_00336 [Thalassiosira oceanica]